MNDIPNLFTSVETEKRIYILRAALFIEDQVSSFLAKLLGIADYKNAKSLSGSGAMSFNQKISLLIDISALDDDTRKLYQKFMEIRNVFLHDIEATTYEKCVSKISGGQLWLLKRYPQDTGSLEEKLENAIKHLCIEIFGKTLSILKPLHDKWHASIKSEQYTQQLGDMITCISEVQTYLNEHGNNYLRGDIKVQEGNFPPLGDYISKMFYESMTRKSLERLEGDELEQALKAIKENK